MPYEPPLTVVPSWAEILAAIGQLGSAIAAAIAAYFAYRTVSEMQKQTVATSQEMRSQTEIMLRTFRLSYAPHLLVDWQKVPSLDVYRSISGAEIHQQVFPEDANEINQTGFGSNKDALELLHNWWSNPSRVVPVDHKYIVLKIENNQNGNGSSSSAINVKGVIKLRIPNRRGFPQEENFDYRFDLAQCAPGKPVIIPIKVEGVPWMELELANLKYKYSGENKDLDEWRGNAKFSFNFVNPV
jgi:hypothetical protein